MPYVPYRFSGICADDFPNCCIPYIPFGLIGPYACILPQLGGRYALFKPNGLYISNIGSVLCTIVDHVLFYALCQ